MKNLLMAMTLGLLFAGSQAQAGQTMELECRIGTGQASTVTNVILKSGEAAVPVACNPTSCPGTSAQWDIKMQYNGNGYEKVTVEVSHLPSLHYASAAFPNLTAGTDIDFTVGAKNQSGAASGLGLYVLCTVNQIK